METNLTDNDYYFLAMQKKFLKFYIIGVPIANIVSLCGCFVLLYLLIWRQKSIRYPFTTNMAICCLLVADVLYLASSCLLYLGKVRIIPRRIRDISKSHCHVIVTSVASFVYCQCYLQCIISIERLIAVRCPFKVKLWITKKRMIIAILICGVTSAAVASGTMPVGFQFKNHKCEINPANGFKMALLAFVSVIFIPGIILVASTIGIIVSVVCRLKLIYSPDIRRSVSTTQNLRASEVRLALMLVVMDIIFVLMGLPYAFFTYMVWLVRDLTPEVQFAWNLSLIFTSLGPHTDWIVIFALGSHVRRALFKCNRQSSPRNRSQSVCSSSRNHSDRKMMEEFQKSYC